MAPTGSDDRLLADTERRRTELRQLYASRIAPMADPLVREAQQQGRAALQGLAGLALAVAVAAGVLSWFDWPALWWSDPAALVRVGLATAIVGLAWLRFNRRGLPFPPMSTAIDARVAGEILPRAFEALRPSATYSPGGAIDRGWIRQSALVDGVQDYASEHLVTWTAAGAGRQLAQVDAVHRTTNYDGETRTHVVFKGLVAIAELGMSAPGHVRMWASDVHHEPPEAVSGLPPVTRALVGSARVGLPPTVTLDPAYEIGASTQMSQHGWSMRTSSTC